MKYSREFKIECVEKYLAGEWMEQPEYSQTTRKRFRKEIVEWSREYRKHGKEEFLNKKAKEWTAEKRYELVKRVIAGESATTVALDGCVGSRQLRKWVREYKEKGYAGLQYKKEQPAKGAKMNKEEKEIIKTDKEELKRLKRENEYLRAENAYLKALRALIAQEKTEKSIKATKQKSSQNSETKDTD